MSEYIINTEQIKGITPYLLAEKTIPSWLVCWALWDVSGAVPQRKDDGVAIGLPEIVRCRDCEFADWDITAWWCTRDKHYPFEIGELRGYGERSHLDGFCAWGEREDGDAR